MALKEGLGILFDMDGVLADVTHSQHAAIIQTAKLYGVEIGEEDIGPSPMYGRSHRPPLTRLPTQAVPRQKEMPTTTGRLQSTSSTQPSVNEASPKKPSSRRSPSNGKLFTRCHPADSTTSCAWMLIHGCVNSDAGHGWEAWTVAGGDTPC